MLNRLKDGARITDQDPTFKARYIGKCETFTAAGKGCTTPLVQKLWDNSGEEHELKRVQIRITTSGIHLRSLESKKEREELFDIENISFCTVDTAVNERIFSWIYTNGDEIAYECHAVICSSTEKAKAMSLVLSRAFQIAYREWKASQIKSVRHDEMKQRSASLGKLTFPTKLTRSKGQRSKSVAAPEDIESPEYKRPGNRMNGVSRTLSEPESSKYVGKDSVGVSSQTNSVLVPSDGKHKEIGVQADSTHF